MNEADARRALVGTARRLEASGLNHNASGNLSIRVDQGILVTPTGIPASLMEPDDGVMLAAGRHAARRRRPPPDQRVAPPPGAVPPTRRRRRGPYPFAGGDGGRDAAVGPCRPIHYVVARFGGSTLPCAPYATYGTDELVQAVVATLGASGLACLMANHGAVSVGPDLATAASLATDVEWLCGVWRRALQLGTPEVLDDAEIARVRDRLLDYGQRPGH